jgi:hypothetical protein
MVDFVGVNFYVMYVVQILRKLEDEDSIILGNDISYVGNQIPRF